MSDHGEQADLDSRLSRTTGRDLSMWVLWLSVVAFLGEPFTRSLCMGKPKLGHRSAHHAQRIIAIFEKLATTLHRTIQLLRPAVKNRPARYSLRRFVYSIICTTSFQKYFAQTYVLVLFLCRLPHGQAFWNTPVIVKVDINIPFSILDLESRGRSVECFTTSAEPGLGIHCLWNYNKERLNCDLAWIYSRTLAD